VSPGARLEWHLTRIEGRAAQLDRETAGDLRWLIHEVRRGRAALLQILSRCQDADDDPMARAIKYAANEALELYDPR
jgi:hypothetical protein